MHEAKSILLWCATPAAVLQHDGQKGDIFDIYFHHQHHESLADYLQYKIVEQRQENLRVQVGIKNINSKPFKYCESTLIHGYQFP